MKGKRSTIKDVAAEANVSISTVSLVMNEKDGVSPETRRRVLKAAKHVGYVPTQAARTLATQKTGNIGFVLREDHFTRTEPFYTRVFLGAEFEARHKELYVLLATIPKTYLPGEHTPRFLKERNVDGLLVAGRVDPAFLEEARAAEIPIMLIDFEYDELPTVVIDNQNGARSAVEHLLERGHRRIAFVGADMGHPSLRLRLEGYRMALSVAGYPADEGLVITAPDDEPSRWTGFQLAKRLFELNVPPTAVFCANDSLGFGVIDQAQQQGVAVPEALAVVGFDDVDSAARMTPALSTVRVFKEQMGEMALRYLTELIEDAPASRQRYERRNPKVKIGTELVVRATS